MHYFKEVITIDPEIQFGSPVFTGTRVPVEILFQHLTDKDGLETFLLDFPSVTREQALSLMHQLEVIFSSEQLAKLDEVAA